MINLLASYTTGWFVCLAVDWLVGWLHTWLSDVVCYLTRVTLSRGSANVPSNEGESCRNHFYKPAVNYFVSAAAFYLDRFVW